MSFLPILFFFFMQQDCYKATPIKQLEVEVKKQKPIDFDLDYDYDSCLATTNAKVYYLKSGEVILIPSKYRNETQGLWFENKKCYDSFVQKDNFPIESENPSVEEKYLSDILVINQSIDAIIENLGKKYLPTKKFGALVEITEISELLIILKAQRKKLSKKDLFNSALVLGEYLRRSKKGKWILLKRYGAFNPYYIPAIVDSKNAVLLFWDALDFYFTSTSNVLPEDFLNLPSIADTKVTLDSLMIRNSYFGYKKIE